MVKFYNFIDLSVEILERSTSLYQKKVHSKRVLQKYSNKIGYIPNTHKNHTIKIL